MATLQSRFRGRRLSRLAAGAAALACSGLAATAATAANNPGTGDSGFFTFPVASPDRTVRVNVASGNLLVDTTDLADAASTFHVTLRRSYNSLAPSTDNILSRRWNYHVDPSVRIIDQGATAVIAGPSGYRITATLATGGSYSVPAGFEGTLTKTTSGWVLARPASGETLTFNGSGELTSTTDSAARTFTVQTTSAGGKTVLSSYGIPSGQRINFSYNGNSHVLLADDPASGHHDYTYAGGLLASYESPADQTTSYGYDSNGFLDSVTLPSGTEIETVNDSTGRVTTFSVTQPGQTPDVTTLDYSTAGQTTVTSPGSDERTYFYDDDYRVTGTFNPNVPLFPDLSDMRGDESPAPDEDYTPTDNDLDETDPTFTACAADAELDNASYCYTDDEDADGGSGFSARAAGPNAALLPGGSGWGLADQRAFPLGLPEVTNLSVNKFRVIIPWDVVRRLSRSYTYTCTQGTSSTSDDESIPVGQDTVTPAEVDAVIQAAQARGDEITVTFGRTRQQSAYCALPTPSIYKRWVGAILDRYPGISNFTVWNEPNDAGQPTSMAKNKHVGPRRAAQYYKALRSACVDRRRSCKVAAPDFLDKETLMALTRDNGSRTACRGSNPPSDCKSYFRRYMENLDGAKPKYWSYHAYEFASTRSRALLSRFIARTQASAGRAGAEYWLTEQGGRAHLPITVGGNSQTQGPVRADADLQYLLNNAPEVDSRITRFYLYNYSGSSSFDSGLTDFRFGSPGTGFAVRRMYCTYLAKTSPGTPCTHDPQTDTDNNNLP